MTRTYSLTLINLHCKFYWVYLYFLSGKINSSSTMFSDGLSLPASCRTSCPPQVMDHWCNLQQWCNSWILGTWMVTWTVTWTRAWDDVRFPKGKWLTLLVFLLYQQAQQFCCPKTGATTSSLAQSSPSGQDSTTFWVGSSAQTTAGHKIYKPNQKQRSWRSHSFETRKIPRPCALPQQLLKVIIAASWNVNSISARLYSMP